MPWFVRQELRRNLKWTEKKANKTDENEKEIVAITATT